MPSPSAALTTQRPDLASSFMEFDLEANRSGFIGAQVFPMIPVAKQLGSFGYIPIEQLLKDRDTLRAPGAGYNRSEFTFTKATYACEEHGAEEPIDDREAQMYADYFNAEQLAALRAHSAVLRNYEKRVAAAVFNATTWTSYTTAITEEWDTKAAAVPIADVKTASQAVFTQCGMWPNALICNKKVWQNLRYTNEVIDLIKYAGITDPRPGTITTQAVAQAMDLEMIIVAGGVKDTAIEGQAASLASIWSDEYAMVCKVATTDDPREPCIGRTFHWSEDGSEFAGTIESYRDDRVRSDIVRARHDIDEVVLYVEAGHLLSNATTI